MRAASQHPSLSRTGFGGLLATTAMDLSARAVIAPLLGLEPPEGPEGLGRWIGHMRHGRFTHRDIATAPPVPHEAAIGIGAHYVIGLTLGLGYGLLVRATTARRSTLPLALAYGAGTTVFAWFVMFPATGRGVMGRRGGPRLAALSLGNHVVYGLALGAATERLGARDPRAATRGPHLTRSLST